MKRSLAFACVVVAGITSAAFAQPKPGYDPSSTHIFPAGGQRGTKVGVRVGTECAPPLTRFHLDGAGVSAPVFLEKHAPFVGEPHLRRVPTEIPITYPREWESEIDIAADATLGTVYWRLSCAQGGTPSRPFIIGDLPEFIETESNSTPASAQALTLPVTVNGQIYGERDVDYFRFTAKEGDVISCETLARRLGSILDPVVELLDADGNTLDVDEAHRGDDPVLVLRAPKDGEYLLRIANVTFHGSAACVYRINLTRKPFLLYTFPTGGQAGTEQELRLYTLTGTGQIRESAAMVSLPNEATPAWEYRNDQFSGSVPLAVGTLPASVEQVDNDSREAAEPLAVPRTVDGRLIDAYDQDWYSFNAAGKQRYSILCRSIRPTSECLPTISLTDAAGNELATASSVQATDGACRLSWTAPQDGVFAIRVRDLRFGVKGGSAFTYQLSVAPAVEDFALRLATDSVSVTQGAETSIPVEVVRLGGFSGPIELKLEGLRDGITIAGTTVAENKSNAKIKLKADEDVPAGSLSLKLTGVAKIGEQTIERTARAAHLGVDSEGVSVGPAVVERMHVTVRHKPVFRLYCAEAYQYAHRGTIYPYAMEIERLDGFDGEIIVQRGDRQNRDMDGVDFLTTNVPPGESEFMMPIYLPETMHINVQSQSQLYTQAYSIFADKHGQRQSVLVLSEKRNMIRTLPPVVKLKAVDKSVSGRRGETVTCRLQLERTSNFLGPMQVTLANAADASCSAEPITIPARATEAAITLSLNTEIAAEVCPIRFRAEGELTPGTQVVSEAELMLHITP